MKQLFLIWILLNILLFACNDQEDQSMVVFPDSLEQRINEINENGSLCDICSVEVIEFNGAKYYSLYCDLWSCVYCHVYDEDGVEINWEQETWVSFVENHRVIKTVPICR